jgi:multidrug efflux pump subunit AcrB
MTRKLFIVSLVVLVALLLAGGGGYLLLTLLAARQAEPLPTITVEALYPGASAEVVADTVAAPIEQQVNGVEGMVSMWSQSTDDGRYTLTVRFERGADLDIALVLVQNRVSLALPVIPALVQNEGITVTKKSQRALLFAVLSSPGGKYDALYMGNYARIQIKDELSRVSGVAEIVLVGRQADSRRVWLDPIKLAAYNLTVADVTEALKQQNLPVETSLAGARPQLTLHTLGRLTEVEELANAIVKVGELANAIVKVDGGLIIRLKDVASIGGDASAPQSAAWRNGKPVVVMAVYPTPQANTQDLSAAVQDKLALLRARLPAGLDLQADFAFAPDRSEYLRVDLVLPDAASAERTGAVVERCAALLRHMPGVQDELSLCGPPFTLADNRACILVRLAAANQRDASREQIMERLRSTLEGQVPEAAVRLCDVSQSPCFPLGGYALDFGIADRENLGLPQMTALAEKLAERLRQSGKLTDVGVGPGAAPRAYLYLDIDRSAAKDRGVSVQAICDTLQTFLGSFYINDFNRFGRTWRVTVQAKADPHGQIDAIKSLKIRNAQGEMVPLGSLISVRLRDAPGVIERLNNWPMAGITANPAAGVSLAEARALCEALAEEVRQELGLSAQYRLSWTQE